MYASACHMVRVCKLTVFQPMQPSLAARRSSPTPLTREGRPSMGAASSPLHEAARVRSHDGAIHACS